MARTKASSDNDNGASADEGVELLKKGIYEGRYVPGQRLIEIDLMRDLGVSRGHVREALRRLAAEGLVAIERNRGASVRKISRKEVNDIFDVLTDISVIAVRKAMQNMDEPGHRRIVEDSLKAARRFSRRAAGVRHVQEFMEENARFWNSIGAVADNPVLENTRERLQTLLFRLQMQGLTMGAERELWITQHEEALVAMLEGNAVLAERLMGRASRSVRDAILALPDSAFL
ncbi:MAG: GntR family transcriptional regulator [Gammaproteobacteria bacterium]|nr:GntR family transcriptional regulator [Gammaproteobacteria bacterium]